MSRTRRLAAILAADVAGYSRLMGEAKKARSNASKRCAAISSNRKSPSTAAGLVTVTIEGLRPGEEQFGYAMATAASHSALPPAPKVRNLDGIFSNVRRPEARGRELTRALWYWTERGSG